MTIDLLRIVGCYFAGDRAGVEVSGDGARVHPGRRANAGQAQPHGVDPAAARTVRAQRPPQPRHARHLPPRVQRARLRQRGCYHQGNMPRYFLVDNPFDTLSSLTILNVDCPVCLWAFSKYRKKMKVGK
jgi:hypothetical protein